MLRNILFTSFLGLFLACQTQKEKNISIVKSDSIHTFNQSKVKFNTQAICTEEEIQLVNDKKGQKLLFKELPDFLQKLHNQQINSISNFLPQRRIVKTGFT
jgi:hypothetical protein